MEKVVFAICEGSQDVAFLYRLFSADGFKTYNRKIADFPGPISGYLKKSLESTDYENLKLEESWQKPLPHETLIKDDMLVLLYAVGGDEKKDTRRSMLKSIAGFSIPPDDSNALYPGEALQYVLIYFFDANNKGIKAREKSIKDEICEVTGVEVPELVSGVGLQSIKGLLVGCYIFAKDDGFGKLEDIIIPLMREGNEEIFQKATDFLKLKDESRLTRLKLVKNTDGELEEKYSTKKHDFDEKKSQIGIVGQLQVSGKSNTVIIRDTDYIKLQKIRDNHLCRDILNFIHSL
jgi:hypothetical protein